MTRFGKTVREFLIEAGIMIKIVAATGFVALVLINAAAAAQAQGVTACNDLEVGAWAPRLDLGDDSLLLAPPARILLDTVSGRSLGGGRYGFALQTAPRALPSIHRFSWWERVTYDSLQLTWSNGFSGLKMRLHVAPPGLRGTARSFWDDFGRKIQSAPVVAVHVACNAPLPATSAFRDRFPRGIGFPDADSLLVGARLPRAALELVQESERRYRVLTSPLAPFQGATEVLAIVNASGIVEQLRLSFASRSYDEIVARLLAAYGQSTSQNRTEHPNGIVSRRTG